MDAAVYVLSAFGGVVEFARSANSNAVIWQDAKLQRGRRGPRAGLSRQLSLLRGMDAAVSKLSAFGGEAEVARSLRELARRQGAQYKRPVKGRYPNKRRTRPAPKKGRCTP
jgi:hypothetical protein